MSDVALQTSLFQLTAITPLELTSGVKALLAHPEAATNLELRCQLPLTVARITPEFQNPVLQFAREVDDASSYVGHREIFSPILRHQMELLDRGLRGSDGALCINLNAGLFSKPLEPKLHSHGPHHGLFYALRIGAFPFLAMSGEDSLAPAPDVQALIDRAKTATSWGPAAEELRQRGLLKPVPLNDIVLMASTYIDETGREIEGTLHVSCNVTHPDHSVASELWRIQNPCVL